MALEQDLKLETRISAIEYLLSDLWVKYYLWINVPYDRIIAAHENTVAKLKTETFPGMDPAIADLASSELEEAVHRLLLMQQEMLEGVKDKLGRR
jgi:hypothetical protein